MAEVLDCSINFVGRPDGSFASIAMVDNVLH